MTYFRTCHNCVYAGEECATREILRRKIKTLGITSLKFNCGNRAPVFRAGQRVSVTWPVGYDHDCYGQVEYEQVSWPATIVQERGSRFLIVVDDVVGDDGETKASDYLKAGLFAKVTAGRLEAIGEPARRVCQECGSCGPEFAQCHFSGRSSCLKTIERREQDGHAVLYEAGRLEREAGRGG